MKVQHTQSRMRVSIAGYKRKNEGGMQQQLRMTTHGAVWLSYHHHHVYQLTTTIMRGKVGVG